MLFASQAVGGELARITAPAERGSILRRSFDPSSPRPRPASTDLDIAIDIDEAGQLR